MDERIKRLVLDVERRDCCPGGWDRYASLLAWLVKEEQKDRKDWERIPRAHAAITKVWERRMKQEGY